VQNALYDYYWPGYEDSAPLGHNTVCLLTEVASVRVATPIRVEAGSLQGAGRGLPEYRAQINFPNPWPGGDWTLRDIVDYDLSAVRGLLTASARYRQDLLLNFHRMGQRAVDAGRRGGPFAFAIPSEQHDPHAAWRMRQVLIDGAIEIERSTEPVQAGATSYPAGTDFVVMAQPFRAYAKTLLERQVYPARRTSPGGPFERPYDVTGWTLPLQMGVSVDRIEDPFALPRTTRVDTATIAPATLSDTRRATHYVVDGRGNGASLAINRLQAAGADVSWTMSPVTVSGTAYAAGALVVQDTPSVKARPLVERMTRELGLRATASATAIPSSTMALRPARVGLYKPWVENIDEGWTRWLLERYEFPFVSISDQDLRRGDLHARFDVIILPDQSSDRLMNGHAPGTMPEPYTGGLGQAGALALKLFVDAGGTLIALDSAGQLAINALALPVRNVLADARPDEFFAPGSILRLTLDGSDPLVFGMTPDTSAFFAFSSAFDVRPAPPAETEPLAPPPAARIVGRYAQHDVLQSGWLEGEERIAGRGAIVEARSGSGRVVLIGFRAQHRGQSHATFRVIFNAIHTAVRSLPHSRAGTRDGV